MTHRSTLSLKDAALLTSRIDDQRAGPNGSFFQTCLWGQSRDHQKIEDQMHATLTDVTRALAQDKALFQHKYIDAQARFGKQSNYTIELPQKGSNMKYSDPFIMNQRIEAGQHTAVEVPHAGGPP